MSQQIEESVAAQSSEKIFNPEELEQMLAPIALYPDALLAQVLTAATYPLEVVETDRFVKENQGLKDEALLEAAKDKDWEPSVKAMLEFPDVLAMMDEQLEWTKKLGDAFLAQQSDCMDAVQRLRQKAYAQGNLATTEKQVIRIEPQTQIIIIEPASPEVVFVPVYDTAIIYGDWWYPGYPPYYFFPRRYSGISFFSGVFVGAFWGAWGIWDCNWHSRDVYINIHHYNNFTKVYYGRFNHYWFYKSGQDNQPWRHDPRHREGAKYRDSFTAQRFSRQQPSSLTLRTNKSELRKHDQGKENSLTINQREKARPTINTSKSNLNIQPTINKFPETALRKNVANQLNTKPLASVNSRGNLENRAKTRPSVRADSGSEVRNQRGIEVSTRDSMVQESATSFTLRNNVKDNIKDQRFTRPASSDSSRNKNDTQALAARDRGRSGQMRTFNLQLNRQTPPPLKGSGFYAQVP
jgi:hypothetical protein